LATPSKLGLGEESSACAPAAGGRVGEVSIVVAFRGTSSLHNMFTDARFALQPLSNCMGGNPSAGEAAAAAATAVEPDVSEQVIGVAGRWWRPRWPRWVGAQRSLQPLSSGGMPFDLDMQVRAELQRASTCSDAVQEPAPSNSSAFHAGLGGRHAAPAGGEPLAAEVASDEETESSASPTGFFLRCLCSLCTLFGRCCLLICFPFLPPSDFEEDDEEFAASTLARVRVHSGFSQAYACIREDVVSLLLERLELCAKEGVEVQLHITGHSLGGAIASLFALDLVGLLPRTVGSSGTEEQGLVKAVYTFGSPRLGNAAFRSMYNALVPRTFRLVASRDLVPTLPPSITYRQLGREVWLDDAGELTFVMSWAMRQILPARDSILYHSMLSYFRLLNRAFRRKWGCEYPSPFRSEAPVHSVAAEGP